MFDHIHIPADPFGHRRRTSSAADLRSLIDAWAMPEGASATLRRAGGLDVFAEKIGPGLLRMSQLGSAAGYQRADLDFVVELAPDGSWVRAASFTAPHNGPSFVRGAYPHDLPSATLADGFLSVWIAGLAAARYRA